MDKERSLRFTTPELAKRSLLNHVTRSATSPETRPQAI